MAPVHFYAHQSPLLLLLLLWPFPPQVLDSVNIRAPRVPVLSNVIASPFPSNPAAIREPRVVLGRQLVEHVHSKPH
jgi:hypothetical protein